MRKVTELSSGWRFSRSYNGDEHVFENSSVEAVFPMCERTADLHCILRKKVTIPADYDGGAVYLCLKDFYGDCELYLDKRKRCSRSSAGGSVYLEVSDGIFAGTESVLTVLATSLGGYFALSGVSLIFMSKSHFIPVDGTSCGIIAVCEKTKDSVRVHAVQTVRNPINYDIASYIVTDSSGRVLGSAASKPSQGDVVIDLPRAHLWNGPHDTASLFLTASILRDSTVLDMVQMSFSIRFPELRNDGFCYLGGERIPISGMSVPCEQAERIPAGRLTELASELGANAFRLDAVPDSLPLIEECDRDGFAVWLDVPDFVTGDLLKGCVRKYSEHPSVIFIAVGSENIGISEGEAAELFNNVLYINTKSEQYMYVKDAVAAAAVSKKITPKAPAAVFVTRNSTEEHEKIWAELCSKAGLFAFFAEGLFSEEEESAPGIQSYEPTDAFYFYKSCFSASPFVRILPCEPQGKYADIKCCSNETRLSLTVNGKSKKKYNGTLTKGGLVLFGSVYLPLKENIVRVVGENSSDETEIIVNRKK